LSSLDIQSLRDAPSSDAVSFKSAGLTSSKAWSITRISQEDSYIPSTPASDESLGLDTVSLTSQLNDGSPTRAARLDKITGQVRGGTYEVCATAVASALMRKGFFNKDVQ
jgi:hypothetical protein